MCIRDSSRDLASPADQTGADRRDGARGLAPISGRSQNYGTRRIGECTPQTPSDPEEHAVAGRGIGRRRVCRARVAHSRARVPTPVPRALLPSRVVTLESAFPGSGSTPVPVVGASRTLRFFIFCSPAHPRARTPCRIWGRRLNARRAPSGALDGAPPPGVAPRALVAPPPRGRARGGHSRFEPLDAAFSTRSGRRGDRPPRRCEPTRGRLLLFLWR